MIGVALVRSIVAAVNSRRLQVGEHVWCGAPYGWGRVHAVHTDVVAVVFFESPARPEAMTVGLPVDAVFPGVLAKQTRVHWEDDQRWWAGRIVGGDGSAGYAVRMPNARYDVRLSAHRLYVRWSQPVADPLEVLLAGANESPYFAETRLPFLQGVIEQRAACSSIPAILSSAVELYPHQLQAVLQVMRDPVERYLLADEVGLGKTIEAGLLLRQFLLDHPTGAVTVLAPDALRRQWQDELRDKFFVDEFPAAALRIVAHEAPERWLGATTPGLLVVDEAHRLVHGVSDRQQEALRRLCHQVPRLLLLSATPVLNNESAFLRLLNLLDPAIYDLSDLAGFTARVRARHRIAQAFHALDPGFPETVPFYLDTIRAAFPGDERLASLIDVVEKSAADESSGLGEDIDELRRYVNETYRLHRRVIRHRRARVLVESSCGPDSPEFQVTGRSAPQALVPDDNVGDQAEFFLEDWRQDVVQHLTYVDGEDAVGYEEVFQLLLEAARNSRRLSLLMRARVEGAAFDGPDAEVASAERDILRRPPLLPADEVLLERLRALPHFEQFTSLVRLLRPLWRRHGKVVLFTAGADFGHALARALAGTFPGLTVAEHLADQTAAERDTALAGWVSGEARVLVCDSSAEEGRNLQAADAIIHLDLPASVNRLEQRIGRVDRHGEGAAAAQYVVVPESIDLSSRAWFELLCNGYRLWQGSLASLQYAIEALRPQVAREALLRGGEGLTGMIDRVRGELDERLTEIAAEDELEASFHRSSGYSDTMAQLDRVEAAWPAFATAVDDLAFRADGSLQLQPVGNGDTASRSFGPGQRALLTVQQLAGAVPGTWNTPGAFNRTAALRRKGHRVLRYGSPLVDSLASWVWIDDRGQASALWRFCPNLAEEQVYLAFDYLVEADLDGWGGSLAPDERRALRRRLDGWLAPFTHRVHVDAWSRQTPDPATGALLRRRYEPRRGDVNLSPERIGRLHDLFGGERAFRTAVTDAHKVAPAYLQRERGVDEVIERASRRARLEMRDEIAALAARGAAGLQDRAGGLTDDLVDRLLEACRQPSTRLYAVTCIVLSGQPFAAAGGA
ncbi:hypothetical protein GCM10010464_04190 [Pseudonocardia yunnanensis]